MQRLRVRRLVRSYVATALDRQRRELEHFIAEHLEFPDAFPLDLTETAAAIREIARVQIVPQLQADYPPVNVTAGLRVALMATAARRELARGIRTAAVPNEYLGQHTFAVDLELKAVGIPAGRGYELRPLRARLTARWGYERQGWTAGTPME